MTKTYFNTCMRPRQGEHRDYRNLTEFMQTPVEVKAERWKNLPPPSSPDYKAEKNFVRRREQEEEMHLLRLREMEKATGVSHLFVVLNKDYEDPLNITIKPFGGHGIPSGKYVTKAFVLCDDQGNHFTLMRLQAMAKYESDSVYDRPLGYSNRPDIYDSDLTIGDIVAIDAVVVDTIVNSIGVIKHLYKLAEVKNDSCIDEVTPF